MSDAPGQPAIPTLSDPGRIAVLDIGSNSIRLVVYDHPSRAPTPIFNEKILCGLGKTLERTGRLNPEGVDQALASLSRFRRLVDGMQVARTDVLATAAVRDAADGPEFVRRVEALTGFTVSVLSGEEEARLAALGVLSGAPGAHGLAGDLGGASLELVALDQGSIGTQVTTPLGPLRLAEVSGGKPGPVARHIDQHLAALPWITRAAGGVFYPVGGSWRALAKMHMEEVGHPLHIIHQYSVDGATLGAFAGSIARMNRSTLERNPAVSRRRLDTLPLAALVLERVVEAVRPGRVSFSACGLREGHLFSLLTPDQQALDPLLVASAELAERLGRFGVAEFFHRWTAPLFAGEDEQARRLRRACCLVSDLGWREHPDYRADHAFLRIMRMPYAGIEHAERAFMAAACFVRYAGTLDSPVLEPARLLLKDTMLGRAHLLGLALRLAHTLSGGAALLLERTSLRLEVETLTLVLPQDVAMLAGDTVQRRLDSVAKALGRRCDIAIVP